MELRKNAKLALLRRIPLFSGCSKRELGEIAKIADELDFREGKVLTREGAAGREFFVIVEGTAEATQGRKKLRTMGDGDFFGEISLLTDDAPTADVVATTVLRCLVIAGNELKAFLLEEPSVMYRMLQVEARRLRAANVWNG